MRRGGQDNPGRPSSVCQEAEQEKLAPDQLPAAGVHAADGESPGQSRKEGSFTKGCRCCSKKVCQIYVCGCGSLHVYTTRGQKLTVHSFVYATSNFDKIVTVVNCSFK